LKEFYEDNLSVGKNGKYAFLKVVATEVIEFTTQTYSANAMAGYTDWHVLSVYLALLCANSLVFGLCMILPEQFISTSAIITVEVLFG
jgi:hypothetical protein